MQHREHTGMIAPEMAASMNETISGPLLSPKAFREFGQISDDGFFIVDERGFFKEANPSYCNLVGYSREQLLGISLDDIEVLESACERRQYVDAILTANRSRFLTQHRIRNGSIIDVEITVTAFTLMNAVFFFVFVRNIEHKREKIWRDLTKNALLELFVKKTTGREYLDSCVELLRSWTRCRHVGISALDRHCRISYQSINEYDPYFQKLTEQLAYSATDCACRNNRNSMDDTMDTFITPGGSFFCNDKQMLYNEFSGARGHCFCGISMRFNFKSIALIPCSHQEQTVGLIHLADHATDMLPESVILFVESIAPIIGEAIGRCTVEEELRLERHKLMGILESMTIGVVIASKTYEIEYVNPAIEKDFGPPSGKNYLDYIYGRYHGSVPPADDIVLTHHANQTEWHCKANNKTYEKFSTTVSNVDGSVSLVEFFHDITRRKTDEAEMLKLSLAVEQSTDWILIADRNGIIEYSNSIVEQITGYKREEVIGNKPNLIKSGIHDEEFYKKLWDTILSGKTFRSVFINRRKDGILFYIDKSITPLKDGHGEITHFVASGKDITRQMQMEDKLVFMIQSDVLTGLPNRTLFMDRLNQAISRVEYNRRLIAVLIIDLDHFTYLNDSLGPESGDEIIKIIADRLKKTIRDGDVLARLGSDEFALALVDVANNEDIILMVEKLKAAIADPIMIQGTEIIATVSIGISIYPSDGDTVFTIVQNAHVAFSKAKITGRNNYQFYTTDMNTRASEFMLIEKNLYRALNNDEFKMYYQPYFNARTRTMAGMEALLRWDRKQLGILSPATFIPILEETGMIIPVGNWIVATVCRQINEWKRQGHPIVPVAINISPVQFRQKNFVEIVDAIVTGAGIDPQYLVFELTEGMLLQDLGATELALKRLRDRRYSISIDDFGTGYSSLSYLKRFPLNYLKIDKSFINDIYTDSDSGAIVRAIISLAHNLHLQAIAEGVETEEQLDLLYKLKCNIIQGYYLGRPMEADAVYPRSNQR